MWNIRKLLQQRPLGKKSAKPKHGRALLAEALEKRELFAVGAYTIPEPLVPGVPAPNGVSVDGVVALEIGRGCSGSLLSTGRHILTAQHCLPNGGFPNVNDSLTVRFDVPGKPPVRMSIDAASMLTPSPDWNAGFAGGNGNDIAILELPALAPLGSTRYEIYAGQNELLQKFSFVGYGDTGTGHTGDNVAKDGNKRYGENRFEAVGDTTAIGLSPHALVFDFDNIGNPTLGIAAGNDYFGTFESQPSDVGVGALESMLGDGDSGGPAFVEGRIAGVASYTEFNGKRILRPDWTPIVADVNTSARRTFGEVGVFTRVSDFAGWINQTLSEPYDLTIDTAVLGMGNNNLDDQIVIATYGDYLQITVNGINVHTDLTSQVQRLNIKGSNDQDVIRLTNLPDIPMKIEGLGGNDTISTNGVGLPPAWFTNNGLRIDGGLGDDRLVVDDSGLTRPKHNMWLTEPDYLVDSTSVGRVIRRADLSFQLLGLEYSQVEDLQLKTGDFENDVYVTGLKPETLATIYGGSQNDTFWIGENGLEGDRREGLNEISNVVLDGGLGHDEVFINDQHQPAGGQVYSVDAMGIRAGAASVGYASGGNLERIALRTTDEDDFLQFGTGWGNVPVAVDSGDGSDTFSFHNQAPVGWFEGALELNAGEGLDRLQISDTRSRDPQWYVVTGDSIGRYGDSFGFPTSTFEDITLRGSLAGSSFAVTDTRLGTTTTLVGGGLDDYLYLYDDAQTLDQVQGELYFEGNGGGDLVDMLDALNPVGQTYYFATNQLLRTGAAPIHYDAGVIKLTTGSGNDVVMVDDGTVGGAFEAILFLDTGAGSDTLDYSFHTASVSVDLLEGVATGLPSVRGVENVVGGLAGDWLYGDDQENILRGNAGDDIIWGRGGRDFLIGGAGADEIQGGQGDDLIIGGRVSYDDERNDDALLSILAEWSRTEVGYGTRVKRIRGISTGGLNGTAVLNAATLLGDAEQDQIFGESGRDFYLAKVDEVFGRQTGETLVIV